MKSTDALSRLRTLEDRIARLLEALAMARGEKAMAERNLEDARNRIRALQKEMEGMRDERLKIRNRVERLISNIAELDRKKEEKIV